MRQTDEFAEVPPRAGVKDSLEAIRSTLEAMRQADAAQPVIQLPDWVWGILINDQIQRAKARRLVLDTVRTLHVRQDDGSPFAGVVLNDLVEAVLNDNPDVADD